MAQTKIAAEVTAEDKIDCICTRGHADGTVTLYYKGEEDIVPLVDVTGPFEDQF